LFDVIRYLTCEKLLQVLTDDADITALLDSEVVSNFSDEVLNGAQIPGKVVSGGLTSLRGFVQAKCKQLSRSRCQEVALIAVRKAVEREVHVSAQGIAIESTFQDQKADLCYRYRSVLAQSDHQPIHASFTKRNIDESNSDDFTNFIVSSHNVQERCKHGVMTYISALRCVSGKKGYVNKLVDSFLQDCVRIEHIRQIKDFVRQELLVAGAVSDAVVLQELSPDVIEALRIEFGNSDFQGKELLYFHASTIPAGLESADSCYAMTCIVSRNPFRALQDIEVTTQQATKSVTRRYASVFFPQQGVALVSLHVRHPVEKKKNGSIPTTTEDLNLDNIQTALEEVAGVLSNPDAEGCRAVIALGDFNGPIGSLDTSRFSSLIAEHNISVVTCAPSSPTVPPPAGLPIDGGVVMCPLDSRNLSAADDAAVLAHHSSWTAQCEIVHLPT